jgi:hypothetical protein
MATELSEDEILLANAEVITDDIINAVTRKKKTVFEETCLHCSRVFNNQARYEKHTKEQSCYAKENITYCKLCNVTMENRKKYMEHLYSLEHIAAIGIQKLDEIEPDVVLPINYLDPYLNKDEATKLSTKNLGESFTLVFKSGNVKTVNLVNQKNAKNKTANETNGAGGRAGEGAGAISNNSQNKDEIKPTERQLKILKFLETIKTGEDAGKKIDAILRKCSLEDYKHLQKLIMGLNISDATKTVYIDVINDFVGEMVTRRTKGEKIYNNKDIGELVINLTM